MNCCKPEQIGTKELGKMQKIIQTRRRKSSRQGGKELENCEERITRKEYQRLVNKFENGRFNGAKGL